MTYSPRSRGKAKRLDAIVQQCAIGLVRIRRDGERLTFAAPPMRGSGPVDATLRAQVLRGLRLEASAVRDLQWIDNGPPWIGGSVCPVAEGTITL